MLAQQRTRHFVPKVRSPVCVPIPRHDDLVINSIELHMLQAPSLIDPLGNIFLPQARQVRRVIHADFDSIAAEFRHKRHQQRGARRIGSFSRSPQTIRQYAQLELGIAAQRISQRGDQVLFRLSNVQCREEYSCLCRSDSILWEQFRYALTDGPLRGNAMLCI